MKCCYAPTVERLEDRCVPTAEPLVTVTPFAFTVVHDHDLVATIDVGAHHVSAVNGALLMVKCPFCAFDNEDGALFCEQCLSDLSSVPTSPIALPSGAVLQMDDDGHFTYTPVAHAAYLDSLSLTLSDGVTTSTSSMSLDVTNEAPTAPSLTYSVGENQTLTSGVLAGVIDPDGDLLRVSAVNGAMLMLKCPFCHFDNEDGALFCERCQSDLSGVPTEPITLPSGATLSMDDDGCLVYTPVANSIYTDVFTYTIWDGVTTSVGTVTIDVTA